MDRVILHVDMNSFFASVESLDHPETLGKPMAVCGDVESRRGVILAKNELAKQSGVKTAEPVWQAQRKCPGLILLPPHHSKYELFSRKANRIYQRFTDLVEPVSIDESFLDVTGSRRLFGAGKEIADTIRATVQKELGLTVSVGVSFCKIFAKLGSDYKKPNATTVISRENYRELLYPLPVTDLMSVGGKTGAALNRMGVYTIGELAALEESLLKKRFGKHGTVLYRYSHGLDSDPVRRPEELEEVKSIGNSLTYKRNLCTLEDVRIALHPLAESVGARLRKHGLKCCGVQVTIKDADFHSIDRQKHLPKPTHVTKELYDTALELVCKSWKLGSPIRLLSVTAIHLQDELEGEQLSFFEPIADSSRQEALDSSLDRLKEKYGKKMIQSAAVLKNDLGIGE